MIGGTAGPVDQGEPALDSSLTGVIPDRLNEEKAGGVSIELQNRAAEIRRPGERCALGPFFDRRGRRTRIDGDEAAG